MKKKYQKPKIKIQKTLIHLLSKRRFYDSIEGLLMSTAEQSNYLAIREGTVWCYGR